MQAEPRLLSQNAQGHLLSATSTSLCDRPPPKKKNQHKWRYDDYFKSSTGALLQIPWPGVRPSLRIIIIINYKLTPVEMLHTGRFLHSLALVAVICRLEGRPAATQIEKQSAATPPGTPGDTEVRFKPPHTPQTSLCGQLYPPPANLKCICVYMCVCLYVISHSLEAFSSALIIVTGVTPAWPLPPPQVNIGVGQSFLLCL